MAIEVWLPEGIEEEHSMTVSGGFQTLDAFPFKWFSAEVDNQGPDPVKVMINAQPLPKAVTLDDREAREFDYKAPKIRQIRLYTEIGKTANVIVTTRR